MSNPSAPRNVPSRPGMHGLLTILVSAAAIYLIANHWLHILDALPYLGVVLVMTFCMFGHGGHGSSTHRGHGEGEASGGPARPGSGEGGGHDR